MLNGGELSLHPDLSSEGYTLKDLGPRDFGPNIKRMDEGRVVIQ